MTDDFCRLDKWLWAVRIFKTRSLAAEIIAKKSPRITRDGQTMRTGKPGFKLRVGDQVTVMRARQLFVLEVLGLPEKRLSAPDAQACYNDLTPTEDADA